MSLEKQFITYRDKENALNKRVAGEQMSAPAVSYTHLDVYKRQVDSGVCVVAKKSGTVLRSTSTDISIKNDDCLLYTSSTVK